MQNLLHPFVVSPALFAAALSSANAQALIDNGAVVNVPGTYGSPWNVGGRITVGSVGSGELHISGGSEVTSSPTGQDLIGIQAGSSGIVTVSGAGSKWLNTVMQVGQAGYGSVTISDGGGITSPSGSITTGTQAGGTGIVIITGAGSSWVVGSTSGSTVGNQGDGTLRIENGGSATLAGGLTAGTGLTGTGTIKVSGPGSTLVSSSGLFTIGGSGAAEMTVENGGEVVANTLRVGAGTTANRSKTGTLTLTGAGSKFTSNTDEAIIGNYATGIVNVQDGAVFTTNGTVGTTLGRFTGNANGNPSGTVTVTGAGSRWDEATGIILGRNASSSGTVNIANGGVVNVANGSGTITLAQVTGGAGYLNIGNGGAAGTLNAGLVTSGNFVGTAQVNFNHTGTTTFSTKLSGDYLAVTKSGAGTTILTGANDYKQATTVNGGTLLNNGSLGNTSVTVADGATFGGSGTLTGTLALQRGSSVAPGASSGTLTTGATTFQGGSGYDWELTDAGGTAGSGWDLLAVNGTLALTDGEADPFQLTLAKAGSLVNFDPLSSYSFVIATATGGITGFAPEYFDIDSSAIPEATGTWTIGQTGDSLLLSYSAVPEPSSLLIGSLGLLALFRRKRVA